MIRNKAIICILVSAIFFQSCATILCGSKSVITIHTNPDGAKVSLNGLAQGITPVNLTVRKTRAVKVVTIEKEGYQSEMFTLGRAFEPVAVINLLNWIGWIIDIGTGAVMKYDTKVYKIKLKQDNSESH